tara:strand:+ start:763 stop:1068 length:306 start_codon:yes stop_codon:yes gene_type:complete
MSNQIEYWYDPNHTGTLRILDNTKKIIYGSDPKELEWKVSFTNKDKNTLIVDFNTKNKHHGRTILQTTYKNMRNELHWSDGNIWKRIRLDPSIVINYYNSK